MRIFKILFLTILVASHHVVFAQKISGIASHIYDGDTFMLKKSNGDLIKIRLANIDAPELEQAHGM
jgi:endonuclease YncB( thermonuclease family)